MGFIKTHNRGPRSVRHIRDQGSVQMRLHWKQNLEAEWSTTRCVGQVESGRKWHRSTHWRSDPSAFEDGGEAADREKELARQTWQAPGTAAVGHGEKAQVFRGLKGHCSDSQAWASWPGLFFKSPANKVVGLYPNNTGLACLPHRGRQDKVTGATREAIWAAEGGTNSGWSIMKGSASSVLLTHQKSWTWVVFCGNLVPSTFMWRGRGRKTLSSSVDTPCQWQGDDSSGMGLSWTY